ncbi:MAG: hypothetical protein QM784_25000 [Polyangiaceae bacterium]
MNTAASPVPQASPRSSKLKRYALVGVAIVASYAAAFTLGYVRGRGELSAVEGARASLEGELTKSRADASRESRDGAT